MFCTTAADSLTQDSSVSLLSSTPSRTDFSGEENDTREILDPTGGLKQSQGSVEIT